MNIEKKNSKFFITELHNIAYTEYKPLYTEWTEQDYINSDLLWCEPMTAHALENDEEQDNLLNNEQYIIEEKFDGTRGIVHFLKGDCRVFSRRVSKKTNWFTENTDSLPQIRLIDIPELKGTIIDGEMFIPNRPFKDVSSTLNCKWDKAIDRQLELGDIVFHAFDILYYKGIKVENMKLSRRKYYLHKVIETLKSYGIESIIDVPYFVCGSHKNILVSRNKGLIQNADKYPTLYKELQCSEGTAMHLSPRGYYEYIVATGGEGVILKNVDFKYEHKRSNAYLKIKKFYTREVIITGFTKPTKEYTGKFPNDHWNYWEYTNGLYDTINSNGYGQYSAKELLKKGYTPITKAYFENWIGNITFGVKITEKEIAKLPKDKKFNIIEMHLHDDPVIGDDKVKVLEVGECAGFDEEVRQMLTKDKELYVGSVFEVKCNEVFKDTGKLRHPRFLRFRSDKFPCECTYFNHITE